MVQVLDHLHRESITPAAPRCESRDLKKIVAAPHGTGRSRNRGTKSKLSNHIDMSTTVIRVGLSIRVGEQINLFAENLFQRLLTIGDFTQCEAIIAGGEYRMGSGMRADAHAFRA